MKQSLMILLVGAMLMNCAKKNEEPNNSVSEESAKRLEVISAGPKEVVLNFEVDSLKECKIKTENPRFPSRVVFYKYESCATLRLLKLNSGGQISNIETTNVHSLYFDPHAHDREEFKYIESDTLNITLGDKGSCSLYPQGDQGEVVEKAACSCEDNYAAMKFTESLKPLIKCRVRADSRAETPAWIWIARAEGAPMRLVTLKSDFAISKIYTLNENKLRPDDNKSDLLIHSVRGFEGFGGGGFHYDFRKKTGEFETDSLVLIDRCEEL